MTTPLPISSSLPFHFWGPAIEQGPLPAFFYFGTGLIPFFQGSPIRIISCNLPFHFAPPFEKAILFWAEELKKGTDFLSPFLNQVIEALHLCIDKKIVDPKKVAVGGLSRGGWIAALLAIKEPLFNLMLSFGPMLDPLYLSDVFGGLEKNPILTSFNLFSHLDKLFSRHIRFYIGNRDVRVGTKVVFSFLEALIETAFTNNIFSPPIEMIMTPSIGLLGHGTPNASFQEGAQWLIEQLTKDLHV